MNSITALVTPFTSQGEIDYIAFADLIEWQISEGTDALLIQGSTGEGSTITQEEFPLLIKRAKEVIGNRAALLVGTGTNATKSTIEKTRLAKQLGADMALIIVPYYNLPSDRGCYLHFQKISDEAPLPFIIYYHPGRTGKKMGIDTLVSFLSIPNVYGIKDSSSVDTIQAIIERAPEAKVYSGVDETTLLALEAGATGSICVLGNAFPSLWKQMVTERSETIYRNLEGVMKATFSEVNPVGIKALLSLMGRCRADVRLPLAPMAEENRELIDKAIKFLVV